MPQVQHRAQLTHWPYEVRMVLTLLMEEINLLRQQTGLPPRTLEQVRQAVRDYMRTHPRGEVP